MLEEVPRNEGKEKPPVLYHASRTAGITEFVPRRENFRDEKEGPVIFSTPSKALASAFLVEGHGDDWMQIGFFADIPVVVINADRDKFIEDDTGGVLYTLPSDTFKYDPNKGMGDKEYTSREPVKPLYEERHTSALDAMIENGVQVYFVDKKTFDGINNSQDHGYSILTRIVSENERRGKNIQSLKNLDKSR
jgi:hypothetical protein